MASCKAKTKGGSRCKAQATAGRDYCFFHDPDQKTQARAAQAKGGSKKLVLAPDEVKPWRGQAGDVTVLKSPSSTDLVNLLADTIDEVKTGRIDPKVANATGYLVGIMVRVLELDRFEERLTALEALMTPEGK